MTQKEIQERHSLRNKELNDGLTPEEQKRLGILDVKYELMENAPKLRASMKNRLKMTYDQELKYWEEICGPVKWAALHVLADGKKALEEKNITKIGELAAMFAYGNVTSKQASDAKIKAVATHYANLRRDKGEDHSETAQAFQELLQLLKPSN